MTGGSGVHLRPARDAWVVLRQFSAIVALPGVVAIAVPIWIARQNAVELAAPYDLRSTALQMAGLVLLAAGVWLFSASRSGPARSC